MHIKFQSVVLKPFSTPLLIHPTLKAIYIGGILLRQALQDKYQNQIDFYTDLSHASTHNTEGFCQHLFLIEDNYIHEQTGTRTNAKEIIFKLRVVHEYIGPIALFKIPNKNQKQTGDNSNYTEILKDPLVKSFNYSQLLDKPSLFEQIPPVFKTDLSLEELQLLYKDLRETIYKDGGFFKEIQHIFNREISGIKHKSNNHQCQALIEKCRKQIDQILSRWTIDNISRQEVYQHFSECFDLKSKKGVKKRINIIIQKLIDQLNQKDKPQTQVQDIHLLYISNNEEAQKRLKSCLEKSNLSHRFKLFCAQNQAEARSILKDNELIFSVLCDFRFWQNNDKKIALRNGYHIIKALHKEHPHIYFAFLSNFDRKHVFEFLLLEKQVDFFKKNDVFQKNAYPLFQLTQKIIQQHDFTLKNRGKWPLGLTIKVDKKWRQAHDEIFLNQPNLKELYQEINQNALKMIADILQNNQQSSPPKGSCIRFVKEADLLNFIKERLCIRRVIIGLLNYKNLIDKYGQFSKEERDRTGKYGTIRNKTPYEIIGQFLTNDKQKQIEYLDNSTIRNKKFRESYRILTRQNYHINSEHLLDYITLAEYHWLQENHQRINSY